MSEMMHDGKIEEGIWTEIERKVGKMRLWDSALDHDKIIQGNTGPKDTADAIFCIIGVCGLLYYSFKQSFYFSLTKPF